MIPLPCCINLLLPLQLFTPSVVSDTFATPTDCSPPGSSVHGIPQPRILEWVAISSSRGSSRPRDQTCVSCIAGRFFTTEPSGKSLSLLFKIWLTYYILKGAAPVAQMVEFACGAGDTGLIPGLGRSLEKGMATHSSILGWRIPWTEESGRLKSMDLERVGYD